MRAAAALIAALSGVMYSGMPAMPKVTATPVYHRPTFMGRSRIPGKPGRAGDKLRRLAAEGRLGVRK